MTQRLQRLLFIDDTPISNINPSLPAAAAHPKHTPTRPPGAPTAAAAPTTSTGFITPSET